MAPKAKNVAGSKRSRKGAFGSSNREPTQKFRKNAVKAYGLLWFDYQRDPKYMGNEYVDELRGKDVRFSAQVLNEFLGTPNCDADKFNRLKKTPQYRDIRHTLCGVESTSRWGRSKDTGRHNTLHFANFNLVSRGIEEEAVDMTVALHPDLTGNLVDITRTKVLDTSHGPVLSAQERQVRDNSIMARMFEMAELQLQISGRHVIDAEMETIAEHYPLSKSAVFLCKTGPTFLEPLDDDEAIADEAMDDDEEDDIVEGEANTLMVRRARPKCSEGCRCRSARRAALGKKVLRGFSDALLGAPGQQGIACNIAWRSARSVAPQCKVLSALLGATHTIDTEISSQTVMHVENYEIDASNIPVDTSLNQTLPYSTHTSPTIPHRSKSIITSNRPHRTHKLLAYLHDYILPKAISKPAPSNIISLNAAFSKHQHIPPEVLEHGVK
ncbi:hypothetical protein H5410_022883 [Solanum commersonii]|uniref:Uncharacterized protein n=1 Tax=Solanum commersonii TaxID=4109 RepID=A0A9J5ZFZ8_SOLCO|nr:hypothetical protein H5410_022883 [Solanum commersonii]